MRGARRRAPRLALVLSAIRVSARSDRGAGLHRVDGFSLASESCAEQREDLTFSQSCDGGAP